VSFAVIDLKTMTVLSTIKNMPEFTFKVHPSSDYVILEQMKPAKIHLVNTAKNSYETVDTCKAPSFGIVNTMSLTFVFAKEDRKKWPFEFLATSSIDKPSMIKTYN
jgi:hypothetical protein